jgi:hypothetical protein
MNESLKVQPRHLERGAYLYVLIGVDARETASQIGARNR